MATYFLFHGGTYKRDIDDGRIRIPLTDVETQSIFHDPELSHKTPTSIGTTLHMQKYGEYLSDLAVGDELMIGLVPDAALLRGLWIGSFDAVEGFTVDADLVSAREVAEQYASTGDASGVATFAGTSVVSYDFSNGLGDATKDAVDKIGIYGGVVDDYRNEDALVIEPFADAVPLVLGDALYMRLTVTDLGQFGENSTGGCCNDCGLTKYPTLQMGSIVDVLCFDKQRVKRHCNCGTVTCSGCGSGKGTPTVS